MMRVDTSALADTINHCFDLSMDLQFTVDVRKQFLAQGKALRMQLLDLTTVLFNDGTQAVLDANNQLDAVNAQVANSVAVLQRISDTVTNIQRLVASLDALAGLAVSVVGA